MMDYEILAILLAFGVIFLFVGLIILAAMVVAYWKIFEKAGEAGWKALIPIYNGHVMYKIAWKPIWFWIAIIVSVVDQIMWFSGEPALMALSWVLTIFLIVISILFYVNLAKVFGKGAGFTVGLIFLPLIFLLILAFDSSEYIRTDNVANEDSDYWQQQDESE